MSLLIRASITPLYWPGDAPRAGDAVELRARALQQRLPHFGHELDVPVGRIQLGGVVGLGVSNGVRQGERPAGGRRLLQPRLERAQILLVHVGEEDEGYPGSRSAACPASPTSRRCSIAHRTPTTPPPCPSADRFPPGRDRRSSESPGQQPPGIARVRKSGRALNLPADVPHHLVVLQRNLNRLFQRKLPEVLGVLIVQRERPRGVGGVGKPVDVDVGILDLSGLALPVLQVVVDVLQVERLLRVASRESGQEIVTTEAPIWGACRLIDLRSCSVCLPVGQTFLSAQQGRHECLLYPISPSPPADACLKPAQSARDPRRSNRQTCYRQPNRQTLTDLHDRKSHFRPPMQRMLSQPCQRPHSAA